MVPYDRTMFAALLVIIQVASVTEVASPRPNGWVTDQANVISAEDEARLDAIAGELNKLRGIELAVVTVDTVPGTPKQFATDLFNHWKIGSAATNNGVLVLLVMSQRRLEVETGDGMEGALPAVWLSDMQKSTMVPRFKAKDFGGGLVDGVTAMAEHIKTAGGEGVVEQKPHEYRDDGTVVTPPTANPPTSNDYTPSPVTTTQEPSHVSPPREDSGPPTGAVVGGGLGLAGLGGGAALLLRHRRRQRRCLTCQPNREMMPLSEIEDDAHLDAGQRAEERIGSVNYEVLVCPGCQATKTLRDGKWFSGFGTCSGCSYKTEKSSSTTLVHATYDHGGQVQVTETCAHCNRVHTYVRHTARRTRPSTTSSSSGGGRSSFSSSSRSSGFGGGRSSGGGSGSSW